MTCPARDWNEELQTTRELPRKNLPERLLRERAIFKVRIMMIMMTMMITISDQVHSDFVSAATRGAMAVIDGNVMAINLGEEAKMQMFIWNNIFSIGFDVKDHYKDLGGTRLPMSPRGTTCRASRSTTRWTWRACSPWAPW